MQASLSETDRVFENAMNSIGGGVLSGINTALTSIGGFLGEISRELKNRPLTTTSPEYLKPLPIPE